MKKSSPYYNTEINNNFLDLWEQPPANSETITYVVEPKYHQRPDLLAFDRFGSPNFWWIFSIYNKDLLIDPIEDLVAGLEIKLPTSAV